MGVPTQPDYAKLRRDADRLVMLLSDPHPDLATWGVVLESVMSRLVEVAPTLVLSRELLRRHPEGFLARELKKWLAGKDDGSSPNRPPPVGSEPDDLAVHVEPSDPNDPTSVRIAGEMNAWLLENQLGLQRLLQKELVREFSRWLAGKDDVSSCDRPPAVGSEPSKEDGS
jgi:hypothetical protein